MRGYIAGLNLSPDQVQLSEHGLNARMEAQLVPIEITVQILDAIRILRKRVLQCFDREFVLTECVLKEGDLQAPNFPGLALRLHYLPEDPPEPDPTRAPGAWVASTLPVYKICGRPEKRAF